jgi:hypothetical protein
MIVRIMGEGQYRIEEDAARELNELDEQVASSVDGADEEGMRGLLQQMAGLVRDRGERLADDDLSASDAIVPPEDLSLDEVRELLEGEGLIPDLPTA